MKTKLSFANKKRLLLLFVLLLGPFLFEVHPPGNFSGYGPDTTDNSISKSDYCILMHLFH